LFSQACFHFPSLLSAIVWRQGLLEMPQDSPDQ
jgi:hypothetical protein